MDTILKVPPIQHLNKTWYNNRVSAIDMLRLDMVHPIVSGNKWYKLKHNIAYAKAHQFSSVLTFGGAYSNHLIATAAAAHYYGITAIGIVRGYNTNTETLKACQSYGMQLVPISYEEYNLKAEPDYLQQLSITYNAPFIIPEGGANEQGRLGCEEIAQYIPAGYTHVCLSLGTGTTFIGLRNALNADISLLGYVPMKGGKYLQEEVAKYLYLENNTHWQLFDDWHNGGFGKWTEEQLSFMNTFNEMNNIPLDLVYTAKMMMGLEEQLHNGFFDTNARILCIHTGGLQGNVSVADKLHY